jgi:hypothetical protein
MQIIAEEKKKEYCCLVYSERALTVQDMNLLKRASVSSVSFSSNESDGQEPGLEVTQRTPLRVCHRRSCIERTKFVYSMDGLLLNGHFFLLKLTTSAGKKDDQLFIFLSSLLTITITGAYVKEFVHSDFGRTAPSVKSLLGGTRVSHSLFSIPSDCIVSLSTLTNPFSRSSLLLLLDGNPSIGCDLVVRRYSRTTTMGTRTRRAKRKQQEEESQ